MSPKKLSIYILIIAVLIVGLGYLQYRSYIYSPILEADSENGVSAEEISFQVKKGQTIKEIAAGLEKSNLIKSDLAFRLYVKLHRGDEKILAGRFILQKTLTVPELIAILKDPSKAQSIITIQEGLRIKDIDKKLVELDLISEGEFISAAQNFTGWEYYSFLDQETLSTLNLPVEGYLYPDTYFLDGSDFEPHDLIYLALDNFETKTAELRADISASAVGQTYSFHEIITMASIIENEVFGATDRKTVSGILWKRLENNWPLGADATLLYITNDRTIDSTDLEIDSPYNTRKNLGLPPGPISNPSLQSIEATLYPEESRYWFYLNSKSGETIYAATNEEHNQNREKYLK